MIEETLTEILAELKRIRREQERTNLQISQIKYKTRGK